MLRTGQVGEEQHIVDYLWREECHFEHEQGRSRESVVNSQSSLGVSNSFMYKQLSCMSPFNTSVFGYQIKHSF